MKEKGIIPRRKRRRIKNPFEAISSCVNHLMDEKRKKLSDIVLSKIKIDVENIKETLKQNPDLRAILDSIVKKLESKGIEDKFIIAFNDKLSGEKDYMKVEDFIKALDE